MPGTGEVLDYMYGLQLHGVKLGLDNITKILSRLGDPHMDYRTVHVAGTNGKGSVCAMTASILREAGKSVGLYTSPHLVRFNERIVVDGEPITDEELVELAGELQLHAESMRESGTQITFFEFTTALAFKYFSDRQVDYVVAEVGMGGRLDATNVLEPDVSVISQIGLEHTKHLGDTVEKIASEKAGIVKPGIPVVTSAKGPALDVVMAKAVETGSIAHVVGKDISFEIMDDSIDGLTLDLGTRSRRYEGLAVPLAGAHQAENATLAVAAVELLPKLDVSEHHVRRGLERARWPGRLEVLWRDPYVVLDCAHNLPGARALVDAIERYFPDQRRYMVFGMLRDKDFGLVTAQLCPLFEKVFVTSPGSDRALDPASLAKEAEKYADAEVVPEPGLAFDKAMKMLKPDDVMIIAGSVYLAGEILGLSGRA